MADIQHTPDVDIYKKNLKDQYNDIMTDIGTIKGFATDPDLTLQAFQKNRQAIIRLADIAEALIRVIKQRL